MMWKLSRFLLNPAKGLQRSAAVLNQINNEIYEDLDDDQDSRDYRLMVWKWHRKVNDTKVWLDF